MSYIYVYMWFQWKHYLTYDTAEKQNDQREENDSIVHDDDDVRGHTIFSDLGNIWDL